MVTKQQLQVTNFASSSQFYCKSREDQSRTCLTQWYNLHSGTIARSNIGYMIITATYFSNLGPLYGWCVIASLILCVKRRVYSDKKSVSV